MVNASANTASANLADLLGPELMCSAGKTVGTASALSGKKNIALYFSAHWCPPCRGFTPVLAKHYSNSDRSTEVVFVSSDRGDAEFKEYFDEMPWLAVPFASRDIKEKLSKLFGVRGIPTLVVLGSDGKLITKDGRSQVDTLFAVASAPTPAVDDASPLTDLLGPQLLSGGGSKAVSTAAVLSSKKNIALYFSAHWCPPCRGFTPVLAQRYSKSDRSTEVVFVSSDRGDAEFKEYYGTMPWLAVPFASRDIKEKLSKLFGVSGIPTLVVLGSDGKLITKDGRSQVDKYFAHGKAPAASADVVEKSVCGGCTIA